VLLGGGRAIGVEVECGGVMQQVFGRRITLCAGAVASPAILLRSGIGPRGDLIDLGIEPVLDLPGVGANLIDHPIVILLAVAKHGVFDPEAPLLHVILRYTAPGSDESNDMQVYIAQLDPANVPGAEEVVAMAGSSELIALAPALQRPRSRGRLSLASADPHVPPRIELNYFADPEDLRRMMEGVHLAWRVAHTPELAPLVERFVLPDETTVASDEALAGFVMAAVGTGYHPVGTAKLGPPADSLAVVDQFCRVHGVEGLRVVDASIMPTIPRANTNLTCIRIGEKVADWMRVEAPQAGEGARVSARAR
jgi:choline dehydrogenase